jgi:trigger factor
MTIQPQYEIEERGATEATVRITIGPEAFKEKLEAVYRRYAREVRIPGFRKGRIPRNVLDSRFGRKLFIEETQEDLERQHLPEALVELNLRPVSRPEVEVSSFEEETPFVFRASFSILPEIDLPDYRGREVSVPAPPPVTEEDVRGALLEVQSHLATLAEKEGDVVGDGDIVRVREGEREWETRADAEDAVTKALVGARLGDEVAIDADLPGGKHVQTTLEVAALREVLLPEIDDEMAKDANFDSLAALKADIEQKLGAARSTRYQQLVESAVLDQIVEEAAIPLPAPFVDELVEEEVARLREAFEPSGATRTFDQYLAERETTEEKLRTDIRVGVERRLQRELVLRKLAADAEIRVEDAELEELARTDAEQAGEDPLRFVGRLKAEDRWGDYRANKVNERVLAMLREAAVVTATKDESTQGLVIDPTKSRQGLVIDPTKEGGGT